ncbi:hypothetical protein D3C72_1959060 [compost metagenome]
MDEEDVGRARPRRAGVTKHPGRRLIIVGRRRRLIGLERHLGVQARLQDVAAPDGHGGDQDEDQRKARDADPLAQGQTGLLHRYGSDCDRKP